MVRPLVFALVMLLGTTAAWAEDANDCLKGEGDIQIRGCSRIIKSRKLFGTPITKDNLAQAYTSRGNAYQEKGEVDRAIADFEKVIALNPKDAAAYNNRGVVYGMKGEVDRAIADFDKVIALNPKDAKAYNNRGFAYIKKGDKDQAIADFRKALEIDPSDQNAKNNLKALGVTP